MRTTKIFIALLCSVAIGAHAETVLFAGNVARADVPAAGYEHFFEEERKTLVFVSTGRLKAAVRFTFNSLQPYLTQKPNVGLEFIEYAASKKSKPLFDIPGNGGKAFFDFTREGALDGKKAQDTHGMMGLRDGYVTFTITIDQEHVGSAEAQALVSTGIKSLLGRIRGAA